MKVLVLYGGRSVERDVSLVSGQACAEALQLKGHEATLFDMAEGVPALLAALETRPDLLFNALHGRWGEDGNVQGLLNLLGIPYTHSGLLASALAMDKVMAKRLFTEAGLRCPDGLISDRASLLAGDPLPRPYVVKPVAEGSSMGVVIVRQGDKALPFSRDDWPFGDEVLVEPYIHGRELTVAVMGERPLAVTELRPRQGFYDYAAKYTEGKTDHLVPAPIDDSLYRQAMEAALLAHQVLGCRGVTRADFRFDDRSEAGDAGGLYLLEVNTQPGMTPLSLVPEQATYCGISFPDLVEWMAERAQCD